MEVGEMLLGRYEQGVSNLEQAMRISPRDSTIGVWHMDMGRELLALHRYDEAIQEGLKATDSGFRTVLSYTSLAAFYAAADNMPEAKAALAEAMKFNPKLSVAWFHAHDSDFVDMPPGFRGPDQGRAAGGMNNILPIARTAVVTWNVRCTSIRDVA
jgi:tetratricopeptide (TPR) repeat protein